MTQFDCYEVLEVSRDASHDEIKASYRRLAFKYHPDKNPGDKAAEDKCKMITEAYAIIGDEKNRALYDADGFPDFEGGDAGGYDFTDIFSDIGDILGDFKTGFGKLSRAFNEVYGNEEKGAGTLGDILLKLFINWIFK